MQLTERAAELWTPPRGLVTVELRDADSGRVVHREQKENFLTADALAQAKWWQRMMWSYMHPVVVFDANTFSPKNPPMLPAEHLAYWNDATAEDPVNEHRVGAPIVGWAGRLPVGSPTGRRGVVNIILSELTAAHAKWVFDWNTTQGNGTFQSVGWTRLDELIDTPIVRMSESRVAFTGYYSGPTQQGGGLFWDATNNVWLSCEYNATGARVLSYPAAGGAATPLFIATGFAPSYNYVNGICKLGTDFYVVGVNSSYKARLQKYNAAYVQQYSVDYTSGTVIAGFYDITTDGSVLYACGNDGKIYRLNPATGAVTATITPADAPAVVSGIAYDPADGNLWIVTGTTKAKWYKIDTSGNVIAGPQFCNTASSTGTSSSPFAGSYTLPGATYKEGSPTPGRYGISDAMTGLSTLGAPGNSTQSGGTPHCNLCMKGTSLFATEWDTYEVQAACELTGHNLATRVKLSAAVTKTSAQTLEITYEFDFS